MSDDNLRTITHEERAKIKRLIEECQLPLSSLYHELSDIFDYNPPELADKITKLQGELDDFKDNTLPCIEE